jgi:hypothetical protein
MSESLMIVTSSQVIPLLENGDRLTRHEFERRYSAMPYRFTESNTAELIEGIVYMASPLRIRSHAQPHSQMVTWLGLYQANFPNLILGIEPTIRLDLDNEPQPDAVLFRSGGNASITDDDYIAGAPELMVEISASTVSIDLHDKKNAYRRNGVQEYVVWRTLDREIDWFSLQNGAYIRLEPNAKGVVKSQIFSGLWLAVESMMAGNMTDVLSVLRSGVESSVI